MAGFEEKLKQIAAEKERLALAESALRAEATAELDRVNAEIEALEDRKEQLEAFLGVEDGAVRAGHGQILGLCLDFVAKSSGGVTSSQVKDAIEAENPGLRVSSVPGTLSRLAAQGRLRRDEAGKYYVA
jgi:hypothetical protein